MSKKVERIRIGKKLYSLNDIWRLCREMWADIKDEHNILTAKDAWVKKQGFGRNRITSACFFCHWAAKQHNQFHPNREICDFCPGRAVSPSFNCCNDNYYYRQKPKKFEAKIRALDRKRIH